MAAKTKPKTPTNPTDFLGNPLTVGDMIAFNPPGIKGLGVGIIVSFAPKSARVQYARYSSSSGEDLTNRDYTDIVKLPDEYRTMYLLTHGKMTHKNTI